LDPGKLIRMSIGNVNKKLIYVGAITVLLAFAIVKLRNYSIYLNNEYLYTQYNILFDSIAGELVLEKPLPSSISDRVLIKHPFIYVLGGNQDSLVNRFRKAASLYNKGFSKKILILSRPGITDFHPELGRNLTNNEWAIKELEKLNVRKEDIEPIHVQKTTFGTMGEAKDLSNIVRKKGCNRLILVTSDYHTKRALHAFSKYGSDNSFELYMYGSKNEKKLIDLLSEYMKLFIYDHFAIPGYD
jgi:uncharacterized SAM-binding protein YcdF (DUF218 family)